MNECTDCEFKGYSPEFCYLHVKACGKKRNRSAGDENTNRNLATKVIVGAGVGVAAVVVGSTAVSFVGGAVLMKALVVKLGTGAGLAGGGIGFFKGLKNQKHNKSFHAPRKATKKDMLRGQVPYER